MPSRRTFVSLAAAAAALLATAPAFALGGLVDVQLVDRGRQEVLPVHAARGASWVAGHPGSRYAVRLSNRSGARVLVVLSVDGVNAVSGETAAVDQTGYVLAPYQTTEITGWRKSQTEAAAFYFTAQPDSYAARTDRPDNVGVVGAAVFRERESELAVQQRRRLERQEAERARVAQGAVERQPDRQAERESARDANAADARAEASAASPSTAAPATPSMAAAARKAAPVRDERMGTGHGEREYSPTTSVEFERASARPDELVRLRYDSRANLIASGVIRMPPRTPPGAPDPFPMSFVPDPKG